jgi:hypothetical protein
VVRTVPPGGSVQRPRQVLKVQRGPGEVGAPLGGSGLGLVDDVGAEAAGGGAQALHRRPVPPVAAEMPQVPAPEEEVSKELSIVVGMNYQ